MISARFTKVWSSLTAIVVLVTAIPPMAGSASTAGKKNTALVLTGATVYSALKGHGKTALVLGAGSAYAWKRTADSKKHDKNKKAYAQSQARKARAAKAYAKHHKTSNGRHVGRRYAKK